MTTMTTAATPTRSRFVDPHPRFVDRFVDRFVVKMSLAMLDWARRRAERASVGREQHELLRRRAVEIQQREHEFAKRAARVL